MNEKRLNGRIAIMSISAISLILSILNTFFLFVQTEYGYRYNSIVFRFPNLMDLILHIFFIGVSIALLCYASSYYSRKNIGGSVAVAFGSLTIFPTITIIAVFVMLIYMSNSDNNFNISIRSESGVMLAVLLLILCFVAVVMSISSVFTVVFRSSRAIPIIAIVSNLTLYIWSLAASGETIGIYFEYEMGIQALKVLFTSLIPILIIICLLVITAFNKKEHIAG